MVHRAVGESKFVFKMLDGVTKNSTKEREKKEKMTNPSSVSHFASKFIVYFRPFRFVQGRHERNRFVKVDFFGLLARVCACSLNILLFFSFMFF